MVKPISTKNTEINQMWWQASVIPATQKAEAENCLNLEAEVAVSRDHTTALQPGQQRETLPRKTKPNCGISISQFSFRQRILFNQIIPLSCPFGS